MNIIPARLKKGDTIGVVSPSSPVTQDFMGQFNKGIKFFEDHGFNVIVGDYVFSTALGYAATPQEKAYDINRMFLDPSIHAIVCTQGGNTANSSLPYLDWKVIHDHPKIFLGISDITVLLNAIHSQTGLVTFHGNDVMWGFGRKPEKYDEEEFLSRLMYAQIGEIPPNHERKTIRKGVAEGKLLGGNLRCLLNLAGTHYFPDFKDGILFVEALDITPDQCDYMFHHLKQIGIFDHIRAAVIGYVDGLQRNQASIQMEDVLLNVTAESHFPILKVNDYGHNCSNTILPVGGQVRIDANKQTIEILEDCVQ
jgi:muramoyltetrapeptide carboxypeptidase